MCDHKFPFVVRVADVVITPRLKNPWLMTVDRHCDCIFCGPHVIRMRVIREGNYHKHQVLEASKGQ